MPDVFYDKNKLTGILTLMPQAGYFPLILSIVDCFSTDIV